MIRKKVRPAKKGLIVLDDQGRQIPWKEDGHELNFTTMISRSVKEGDLEIVKEKEPKEKEKEKEKGGK